MHHNVSKKDLNEFDAWAFCRLGGKITSLDCSLDFPRLALDDKLSGFEIKQWALSGATNRQRDSVIHLQGSYQVTLECVACGQPVVQQLGFSRSLVLKKSEQQADEAEAENAEEYEDIDFVACAGHVNIRDWLEDEMLLVAPMFPKHSECEKDPGESDHTSAQPLVDSIEQEAAVEVHRPFADLGSLLKESKK